MKKIIAFLLLTVGAFAQTDVKLTATIQNRNTDSIMLSGNNKFKKVLRVNKDGVFADKFVAAAGLYQMYDGVEYTMMYFKPGYDLNLKMDAKKFDESIVYTGKGEKENNFLAQKTIMEEEFQNNIPNLKSKAEFDAAIAAHNKKLADKLNEKGIDPDFKSLIQAMMKEESDQIAAQAEADAQKQKLNGSISPSFDYENFKGGKTKLEDLRGKYVYIDVWATWCGPCRAEIPHLQKVEEKYKGKNIAFVSLSVDEQKDYEKWKKMVGDKSLGGIQLIADKNWMSDFVTAYSINSIPRFILIDPKGKIVNADAARPSDPELQVLFDSLLN